MCRPVFRLKGMHCSYGEQTGWLDADEDSGSAFLGVEDQAAAARLEYRLVVDVDQDRMPDV